MPTVQVRDFPQALFERLQRTAEEEHRSVPQQVIAITESYIAEKGRDARAGAAQGYRKPSNREALFERLENAVPEYTVPEGFPAIEDLVREDRDNR